MKQHPIPQDITNYKFHLIGSMTLKQFAEVAAAAIIALILYSTNLPSIFKWPIILVVVVLGVMVAFVPIEERPLDHWIITFFKNLYHPTKFYWRKQNKAPEFFTYQPGSANSSAITPEVDLNPARKRRIYEYLKSMPAEETADTFDQALDQRVSQVLADFASVQVEPSQIDIEQKSVQQKPNLKTRVRQLKTAENSAPQSLSTSSNLQPEPDIQDEQESSDSSTHFSDFPSNQDFAMLSSPPAQPSLENPAVESAQEIISPNSQVSDEEVNLDTKDTLSTTQLLYSAPINPLAQPIETSATPAIREISTPVAEVFDQSDQFEPQSKAVLPVNQQSLNDQPVSTDSLENNVANSPTFSANQTPELQNLPTIRDSQFNKDLPLPIRATLPNQLMGMVFDQSNEILPNTLIEILNQQGKTYRVVKSNQLGQFSMSTPLENGQYQLLAEHSLHQFNPFPFELNGKIMPPIELRAID